MVNIRLEYPKIRIMIRSRNKPKPNARKNTHDFRNITALKTNSPTEKGIVVIPLIIIVNTVSNAILRSILFNLHVYKNRSEICKVNKALNFCSLKKITGIFFNRGNLSDYQIRQNSGSVTIHIAFCPN